MTDIDAAVPKIVKLTRNGQSVSLAGLNADSGKSNAGTLDFRFEDGWWVYNLSTKSLSAETYIITIDIPDGDRYCACFILR